MRVKTIFLLLFISASVFPQTPYDCAVQLNASVQSSPAQIVLSWPSSSSTSQYTVFRKLKTALSWGAATATLAGTANSYTDNTVSPGVSYEYRVQRTGSNYTGYGYINSGIELPAVEQRGRMLLIVDSFFTNSLSSEITRLIEDLEGDGWLVSRHDVLRSASVPHVKSVIVNSYSQDPAQTKALFLLGHIPVPYSGNINPDGHPDHLGAWPTDMYYADVDGTWTDVSVTSTTASPARTQNVPGDGKFDQSVKPSLLELQTGRVDLYNLPAFSQTETQLMKGYLDKDHDYRKKIYAPLKRGVVDDNFGYMSGEVFAASGYNAMASVVGSSSITAADYFSSMGSGSYQWSYGCGGGSFTSASGIGSTSTFASSSLDGVFTMLFGSYFGDWDIANSFLRAPLAQGKMLTNAWSGRPHWAFHHMGLGENIGYSALITQNYQQSLYYPNIYNIHGGWIHTGLMGDPSLRNDIVAPVQNVTATMSGYNCNVSWTASSEAGTLGYNIYRRDPNSSVYTKLNALLITGTSFTDVCIPATGVYKYMVRAQKLEVTPSGSYYNLSEGVADTALNVTPAPVVTAQFSTTVNGFTVSLSNMSANGISYSWSFGNGSSSTAANPVVTYTSGGSYTITLIAQGACGTHSTSAVVTISSVGMEEHVTGAPPVQIIPNPAASEWRIRSSLQNPRVEIFAADGSRLYDGPMLNSWNSSGWISGIYLVVMTDRNGNRESSRLVLQH